MELEETVSASIVRLVELEEQVEELTKKYKEGKVSIDDYKKSLDRMDAEADGLADTIRKQGKDVDALTAAYKKNKSATESLSGKLNDLNANWGLVGSSSSAALGIMVTNLNKTNPVLATALGGLQKMVPILAQVAQAAKTSGAALKSALASSGVGLLVVAVTSLIDVLRKVKEKADAADGSMKSLTSSYEELDKINQKYEDDRLSRDAKYAKERAKYYSQITAAEKDLQELEDKGWGKSNKYKKQKAELDKLREVFAKFEANHADQVAKDNAKIIESQKGVNDSIKEGNAGLKEEESVVDKLLLKYSDLFKKKNDVKELDDALKGLNDAFSNGKISVSEYVDAMKGIALAGLKINDVNVSLEDTFKGVIDDFSVLADAELHDIQSVLDFTQDALMNNVRSVANDTLPILSESMKETWGSINSTLMSTQQIMSNVTDSYTEDIERQVSAGKISAKEAKKRLKEESVVQGALSMAAGLSASVYGTLEAWKSAPGGWIGKTAIAASTAASIIGTTLATVKSIKAAGEGLTDSVSSVSSSAVSGATGTTQVYSVSSAADADKITNAIQAGTSKAADSKVVLVVEDLNKVQNNMTQASIESSF